MNIKLILKFLKHHQDYINQETYYPEKQRKSKYEIFKDFLCHIVRHGEIDKYYFPYGLDVKDTNPEDYISYNEFMLIRDNFNGFNMKGSAKVNYACLIRDKNLFEIMARQLSIPTVFTLGSYSKGIITGKDFIIPLKDFINENPRLFFKPVDSFKGYHTFALEKINDKYYLNDVVCNFETIISKLNEPGIDLMVQPKLTQHSEMNRLYDKSINTLRIVTILKEHKPYLIGMFLRLGGHGSVVDNMSAGGLGVGINEDGTLKKYGFLHNKYGTKTTKHPDTGIEFSSFKIPYFKEAIELVKETHKKFYYVPAVGWDVCITEDGPIIIEGNDNFGGIGLQTICGGKAKVFRHFFLNKN